VSDLFTGAIIISILTATIRIATPLVVAAIGELVAERAGVINLGVEGMMLMGCWVAFYTTYHTGSHTLGIAAGIAAGMGMSLVMAVMAITLKLEQFVTGLALNILAAGLTLFWYRRFRALYQEELGAGVPPSIEMMGDFHIPLLSNIPYIGEIFFSHNLITYFAYILVPVTVYFLYRTRYGLELRCLGENPKAIDVKGLSVSVRRYAAVLFGGAMAGLGGAFLSIGISTQFVAGMIAGRGWLAIVIVIAANWLPYRIVIASLIFSFLMSLQLHVQAVGIEFPHQFLLAAPFVAAILAMMWGKAKSEAPSALGVPYHRE